MSTDLARKLAEALHAEIQVDGCYCEGPDEVGPTLDCTACTAELLDRAGLAEAHTVDVDGMLRLLQDACAQRDRYRAALDRIADLWDSTAASGIYIAREALRDE